MLAFSYFYKDLFVSVTPKERSVTPHSSETDATSNVFSQNLLVSSAKAVEGKPPQQTMKFRGQAVGSFLTAVFLKSAGYAYAAPYAVPCKVSEAVTRPLGLHSYPPATQLGF